MNVNYYVDKRRSNKDGTFPVYLKVTTNQNKRFLVSTLLSTTGDVIDGVFPKSDKRAKAKTMSLQKVMAQCTHYVCLNEDFSTEELKDGIADIINGGTGGRKKRTFVYYINEYVRAKGQLLSAGTQKLYLQTGKVIQDYDCNATFDTITPEWLRTFQEYRLSIGRKLNGVGRNMRDIKAVFNYCNKKGYTRKYPFVDYVCPTEKTQHRNLHIESFRKLIDYPCESFQIRYRDVFLLSFYLWGINFGDLLMMNMDDYHDGYIHYDRHKTGKAYRIKVEPEADTIIQKYKGKDRLLCFCEGKNDYHQFLKQCNSQLKKIGMKFSPGKKPVGKALLPDLTTYYARHSIATFAAEIGTPMSTISMGLGHTMSGGAVVTGTYVEFQQWMIDDCMRDVIDYIKSGKDARSYRMSKQVGNSDFADILKDIYAKLG